MYAVDPNGVRVDFEDSDGDSGSLVLMALVGMVFFPFMAFVSLISKELKLGCLSLVGIPLSVFVLFLKSASNLNGNLNCSKELEHYAS